MIPAAMMSPAEISPREPRQCGRFQLFRRGIPVWGYGLLVIVAVISLLAVYPWLAVREDSKRSSILQAPTPFLLVNDGYFPITKLSADCNFSAASPNVTAEFHDDDLLVRQFADVLAYHGKIGLPCAEKLFGDLNRSLFQFDSEASLNVAISYRLLGVMVHTPQRFRFQIQKTTAGQFHWAYRR